VSLSNLKVRGQRLSLHLSPSLRLAFYVLLLTSHFLLLAGQSWAASETLRPNGDFNTTWNMFECSVRYDCVCEDTPDDDATYIYMTTADIGQAFYFETAQSQPAQRDSVIIHVRARVLSGSPDLELGKYLWTEGGWQWNALDTVTLSTSYSNLSGKNSADKGVDKYGFKTLSGSTETRITQFYIVVWYTPPSGGNKRQGGIVQDKNNIGIVEGGIAR